MFQFNFEGKVHRLEFVRKHEPVSVYRNKTVRIETSKYPFTTARLMQLVPSALPLKIASAKVGCMPTDKFSKEKGRLEALALLSCNLRKLLNEDSAKRLNAIMWDTYLGRKQKAPATTHIEAPHADAGTTAEASASA